MAARLFLSPRAGQPVIRASAIEKGYSTSWNAVDRFCVIYQTGVFAIVG
jgi:hypothetical protein